tara:strand:+ start:265 stop:528 length:264 start_codon:yes stop_codon:yes gene_type:complete
MEKKSSFFFIPFWPLLEEQFRVLVFLRSLVFFLGTDQRREEDLKEEDEKKDLRALLLSLVFDENNMIKKSSSSLLTEIFVFFLVLWS